MCQGGTYRELIKPDHRIANEYEHQYNTLQHTVPCTVVGLKYILKFRKHNEHSTFNEQKIVDWFKIPDRFEQELRDFQLNSFIQLPIEMKVLTR